MAVDFIISFLGGTAVVVAVAAWLTREFVKHWLEKDRKRFEEDLKASSAQSLKEFELRLTAQSARSLKEFELQMEARNAEALAALQKQYQLEIASANRAAEADAARNERIRNEIVKWANPILGAVRDLRSRLGNILKDKAYAALQREPTVPIPNGWSIDYDYFMPSTLYLFCQYFYWVKRFQGALSFELFRSQVEMDALVHRLQTVREALSVWPMEPACSGEDAQVFALQQRAMGEALTVPGETERPMGYDEFIAKWTEPVLATHLASLRALLDGLDNDGECRWKRLERVLDSLEQLEAHCKSVLQAPGLAQVAAA
jgi:hypothetical protein